MLGRIDEAADKDTMQPSVMAGLFGDTLYGDVDTATALNDKAYVAIFFGAAWSGSCKQFIPPLVEVYNKLAEEKSLEIVYVPVSVAGRPRDDEESFEELVALMPWLAVDKRSVHKRLTRRFQIRQIPMLVLLDAQGETVHRDISPAITKIVDGCAEYADLFPWSEKLNIKQMLGESFVKGDGSPVSIDELGGKYIGILFSAGWHWQCRRFQRLLEYTYENVEQPFEVVSMDFAPDMPWLAMTSCELKQKLGEVFQVEECPMLIIVDPEGDIVTTEGVEIVNKDPQGKCFPWNPKPLYDLSTLDPEIIGEMKDTVTCIILCEGCDEDTQAALRDQMLPVAVDHFKEASGCGSGILFFTATETTDVVHQIRLSCGLGEPTPAMVLLDIADAGAYYVYDGASVTTEAIRSFIQAYDDDRLERRELQE